MSLNLLKDHIRTKLLLIIDKDLKETSQGLLINGKTSKEVYKVPSYRIELECEEVSSGVKLNGTYVEHRLQALKERKQSVKSFKSIQSQQSDSSNDIDLDIKHLEGDLNRLRLRENIKLLNARKIKFTAPIQESLLTSKDIFKNERAYNNYKKLNLMGTILKNGNQTKGHRRSQLSPCRSNSKSSQKKKKGSVSFSPNIIRMTNEQQVDIVNLNRKSCKETTKYIINIEHMTNPLLPSLKTSRSENDNTESIVLRSPRRNNTKINFISSTTATRSKAISSNRIKEPRKYPNSCIRLSNRRNLILVETKRPKDIKTSPNINVFNKEDYIVSTSNKLLFKKAMDLDEWVKWSNKNKNKSKKFYNKS